MKESPPLDLSTPRIRLTRIGLHHLEDLVALDSDPEVMRHVGGVPNSRDDYVGLLPRMMAYDDLPYGFLAAHVEEAFAGWFHLRPSVADPSILELGYRLRRAMWGKGLATEGSRALLRHAFITLGEREVDACAAPENVASTTVMKKCGMRKVGSFIHPRLPVEVDRYLVTRDAAILG